MKRRTDKEIAYQYLNRLYTQIAQEIDEDLLRDIIGVRTTEARLARLKERIRETLQNEQNRRIRPYLSKRESPQREG